MRTWAMRLVMGSLLAGGSVGAQQTPGAAQTDEPQATFRADINYVEVDVHVADEQGNPVRGLTRSDFEVFENGARQPIGVFSAIEGRVEPALPASAAEPDVRSNFRAFDGRLYVLVLDDLHTEATRSPVVRSAVRRFIEQHIGANDLAAIVSTSGRLEASQEVTSSKRLLLQAVDKFQGRRLRSATLERRERYQNRADVGALGKPVRDPYDPERGYQAESALETIRNIAIWLGRVQGHRKALVMVGEGIDYNIHDVFNAPYASSIVDDARDAIAAATQANVNIYTLDPRGLDTSGTDVDISGIADEANPTSPQIRNMQDELHFAQDSLRVLAEQTGGLAFVNTNDLGGAFERIVRDNTNYYVIGFRSANERRDGKFRKLEVRVSRPGVTVRARRGYIAAREPAKAAALTPSANTSAALRDVLDSPLPVSGLGVTTTAAAFRGAADKASVLIIAQVDGRRLSFAEQGGIFRDDIEISMVAINQQGKVAAGDRRVAELKLKPDTHQLVSGTGIRLLSRIDVPAGRYQLRLGARESGRGSAGSVLYDLQVPDFGGDAPMLSGLVLSSRLAGAMPTLQPDAELRDVLPGPPTADRDFVTADTLWAFLEIYNNDKSPVPVSVNFTLVGEAGATAFRSEDRIEASAFTNSRRAYGYRVEIPLRDVAPGAYVLRAEARRSGNAEPMVRDVPLRVHAVPVAVPGARPQ